MAEESTATDDLTRDALAGMLDPEPPVDPGPPEPAPPQDPAPEPAPEGDEEPKDEPKPEELEQKLIEDMLENDEPGDVEPEDNEEEKKLQEGMKEAQVEAFKKMRRENHSLSKKVKSLEEQVAGAEESDETKALKEELARVKQQLGAIDLSHSEEFQTKFDTPMKSKGKQIAETAKEFGVDGRIIQTAVRMGIRDRYKLLVDQAPEAASVLTTMMGDLDSLRQARAEALNESHKTQRTMIEDRARRHGEAMLQVMDSTVDELKKTNILLVRSEDQKWNELVDKRVDNAKTFIAKSGEPQALAELALKAAMSDDYRNFFLKARQQIRQLEQEIGKRKKATPNLGAGGRTPTTTQSKPDKPRSAEDIAELVTGMASRTA